ncbi:MAG: TPR repeat protein [Lentimonas sp.]|jgi:TPR repeat protein
MKPFKSRFLALSACLIAMMATTTQAQRLEDQPLPPHFEAGLAAYEANNLPLAYTEFLAAAKEGHLDSQFNVALMHENGIGVDKNAKEAVAWYRTAALQGSSLAQFNLAVLYENGRGTEVDFAAANEWYRRASVQGDPLAIGNLGMLYIRGDGVPVNTTAGIALLLQSVTLDSSPANNAKQNISGTRGLTPQIIQAAQELSNQMTTAKNLLVPFDQYLTLSAIPKIPGH